MQGLLLKDIYTLLSKTKFFLILIVFFALLPNASVSAFAIFYSVMLPMTALAYDEQTKWPQLAAMMPYSHKALVGSKYLLGWLAAGFTGLVAWLGNVFTAGSFAPGVLVASLLDVEAVIYVCMTLCLALCFMTLTLPITFFLGVEKGRLFLLALVLVFFVVYFFVDDLGGLGLVEKLSGWNLNLVTLTLAAVAVVSNLLSMALSVWIYGRRVMRGEA